MMIFRPEGDWAARDVFAGMLDLRRSAKKLPMIRFDYAAEAPFIAVDQGAVCFVFPEWDRVSIVAELVRERAHFVEVSD